ncbi:hypothetical protein N7468_000728 [Penicillium chermesinum]|uniref:gamma-glutamylcyclotransferase n=1 Tax=Penicillium chermesinum TaxID=63820 RepID=A0A9W9TYP0_9EURO|nr:uncharacterized protein N7468_000728 [Penicillium chermesinum]KAJ5249277.1 hypothetical protein N7468_000728 [Penicillium chermesinum]
MVLCLWVKYSVIRDEGTRHHPLEAQAVVVPSHVLCFDIFGIPYAEPAFASITAAPSDLAAGDRDGHAIPPVQGVAYLLTADDYRQLVLTEGAGVGYNEISVPASPLSTEHGQKEEILAYTLQAKYPWRPNRAPSARYMGLIIDGANEFNLSESYKISGGILVLPQLLEKGDPSSGPSHQGQHER